MILPRFANKIRAGKPAFGFNTQFGDPALMELFGTDWDFVWIDLQHGTATPADAANLVRTCDGLGLTSLIRIPADMPYLVSWALDLDAGGVIVAQVERLEQAEAMAAAAKFPPVGNRSFGGRRLIDRHGRNSMALANKEQLLILQIESPEAAMLAGKLAGVAGVDGLMIGPDDMKMRLGVPIDAPLTEPELVKAAAAVTGAARGACKLAMGFATPSRAGIQSAVDAGFNLISVGSIARYLQAGSAEQIKAIREWEG